MSHREYWRIFLAMKIYAYSVLLCLPTIISKIICFVALRVLAMRTGVNTDFIQIMYRTYALFLVSFSYRNNTLALLLFVFFFFKYCTIMWLHIPSMTLSSRNARSTRHTTRTLSHGASISRLRTINFYTQFTTSQIRRRRVVVADSCARRLPSTIIFSFIYASRFVIGSSGSTEHEKNR